MESQDNVGTGAEISTENDVPAIFYDGSDGVPQSGAPQREIYQSELAQSQEDIARLTRTITFPIKLPVLPCLSFNINLIAPVVIVS